MERTPQTRSANLFRYFGWQGGRCGMTTSWVIVRLADGKAIAETFLPHVASSVNKAKYRAVPILEYLVSINGKGKA